MPKDRRSSSFDRHKSSPYSHYHKNSDKKRPKSPAPPIGTKNEWEETRCPICIEHPHNAVLLLCSSREKGCRPYICDTSSRHSNCLDHFRKSIANTDTSKETKLVCPLCRGQINGWIIVEPARNFMNSKTRSCSVGTCDFTGNYSQLRKHARHEHPNAKPTEVDPDQELKWKSLEEEIEQHDVFNMQFGFNVVDDVYGYDDDDDELMDGVFELASPIWDYDLDYLNFLSTFESEFESVFPELNWGSGDGNGLLDDWDNIFGFSSSHELQSRESGRSRGSGQRSRGSGQTRNNSNAPTSRTRTNTNRGQRNAPRQQGHRGNPRSHNRQEQVTTLVDFHELRSNLP